MQKGSMIKSLIMKVNGFRDKSSHIIKLSLQRITSEKLCEENFSFQSYEFSYLSR